MRDSRSNILSSTNRLVSGDPDLLNLHAELLFLNLHCLIALLAALFPA